MFKLTARERPDLAQVCPLRSCKLFLYLGLAAMLRVTARRFARRVGAKPAAASNVPAPAVDDWQEVPDNASGKSYWWNKKTNETTPVGAPKPGPDPWEQVKDASGQHYWWNKQTNQTTALGAPKPSAVQPPPEAGAPAVGGMGGGLRGALMDGLAWGVGTSVASRMMDGILGPRQMEVVHRNEDGGAAPGGDASPPPPGSSPDSGLGGGDSWYGDSGGSNDSSGGWFGGGDDGGDGGDGGGGWFGGGDDEW